MGLSYMEGGSEMEMLSGWSCCRELMRLWEDLACWILSDDGVALAGMGGRWNACQHLDDGHYNVVIKQCDHEQLWAAIRVLIYVGIIGE